MRPPAVGQPPDLLTLPPSHYCERARWGLTHAGVPYREVPLAAGLHAVTVRSLAPLSTLPLLRTATEVVQGSDRILDWCGLAVADQDAEERLQSRIGPLVRSFSYAATMDGPHHSDIRRILLAGVPGWQAKVTTALWPGLRRLLITSLRDHQDVWGARGGRGRAAMSWSGETSDHTLNTPDILMVPRIAKDEYQGCPPAVVRGCARQPSIASSVNQIVKLPRWRSAASYAAELVILRFCLGMW